MSRMDGVLPPPLWGRVGERGSRSGGAAVIDEPGAQSSRLRDNPRVAPPSLSLPHKGGGNGQTMPCVLQAMGAQR
ncbi:hypothetical protein EDE08_112244 [Bradyrhizobium sp. R2.2-H]|nr:hypothetical protein EDE10_1128 [Bradyrhizobium sp. Y-H1]TCU68088.1 hypothetical protein EDE08_112244 [Bradyrhizobium sp. R2.2-H]